MYLLVLVCKEAVVLHSTYDNKHTFICCEQYPCQIWYFSVFAWYNTANFIIFYSYITEEWYPQGKQNILPGQMTETLVTNLRPWTVYHLRVFAENQLGKSKDGKVLQVNCY